LRALLLDDDTPAQDLPTPDDWRRALETVLGRDSDTELVLLVDQFEEVFTVCTDAAQRWAMATALSEVAWRSPNRFRLILGMRSEYLGSGAALPGLDHLVRGPWVLRPPGRDAVRAIIASPAEYYGYRFQGPLADGEPQHGQSLLDRILSDPLI